MREQEASRYGPRSPRATKLDPYRAYLVERVEQAKPRWIPATVLLREIAERGYDGGISQLKAWLAPLKQGTPDPVVRLETPPGQQMQADFTWVRKGRDPLVAFVATMSSTCAASTRCQRTWLENGVDLRTTENMLEVFHCGRRIALHALLREAGSSSTMLEHRPVAHQRVLEGEPEALLQWAANVGPSCEKMIGYHLQDRRDPTNGLRAARKMRELARDYGEERFESACAYAWPLNMTALRHITSILANRADLRPQSPITAHPRPLHPNVRGAQYFGE